MKYLVGMPDRTYVVVGQSADREPGLRFAVFRGKPGSGERTD
jgi:hypothetical protein